MKPRRCRAIILQKVDPIGFFNSRQNIGIRNCTYKNVLVDLESCVGIFRWIILSPKRLQGKYPRHYTYSDWLNWIYSPVPDWLKYPGLVKSRQPHLNHRHQMYWILVGKISTGTTSSFILSSVEERWKTSACNWVDNDVMISNFLSVVSRIYRRDLRTYMDISSAYWSNWYTVLTPAPLSVVEGLSHPGGGTTILRRRRKWASPLCSLVNRSASDVRGAWEMGNENFRGVLSILDSHIADNHCVVLSLSFSAPSCVMILHFRCKVYAWQGTWKYDFKCFSHEYIYRKICKF
jgi:hypothetical protein